MKNKLEKRNLTSFDYKARKLGIIGGVIIILSLAILLPLATSISSSNVAIANEIQELNAQIEKNDSKLEKK
ncbi:MAG: hypothetical protein PUA56_04960 [Bacillales bacterium]|nr:hypothetical protein [Bacillales bacterium]